MNMKTYNIKRTDDCRYCMETPLLYRENVSININKKHRLTDNQMHDD